MGYLIVLFTSTTIQLNLPPGLLQSICYVESTYKISAVHHDDGGSDSLGLCQIKYNTAKRLGFKGTEKELMRVDVNIYYAGKYLRYQLHRYHATNKAVIAYNKGNAKGLTASKYQAKVYKEWRQNR